MKPAPTQTHPLGAEHPLLRKLRAGKVLLGMVHLPPLPGSPGAAGRPASEAMARAFEAARGDARALIEEGMDGILIENFGDAPFYPGSAPPATAAAMAAIAAQLAGELRAPGRGEAPLIAVNVLRNDAAAALAVAAAAGLDAIRVNVHCGVMAADQGLIEGQAHRTLRERALLGAPVAILADLLVKHAVPLGAGEPDPELLARDLAYRALADALIVTGSWTGAAADPARLRAVKGAVPDRPLLAGSGVTARSIRKVLEIADGAIVGTSLKADGDVRRPVDPERVRELVRAARRG